MVYFRGIKLAFFAFLVATVTFSHAIPWTTEDDEYRTLTPEEEKMAAALEGVAGIVADKFHDEISENLNAYKQESQKIILNEIARLKTMGEQIIDSKIAEYQEMAKILIEDNVQDADMKAKLNEYLEYISQVLQEKITTTKETVTEQLKDKLTPFLENDIDIFDGKYNATICETATSEADDSSFDASQLAHIYEIFEFLAFSIKKSNPTWTGTVAFEISKLIVSLRIEKNNEGSGVVKLWLGYPHDKKISSIVRLTTSEFLGLAKQDEKFNLNNALKMNFIANLKCKPWKLTNDCKGLTNEIDLSAKKVSDFFDQGYPKSTTEKVSDIFADGLKAVAK